MIHLWLLIEKKTQTQQQQQKTKNPKQQQQPQQKATNPPKTNKQRHQNTSNQIHLHSLHERNCIITIRCLIFKKMSLLSPVYGPVP